VISLDGTRALASVALLLATGLGVAAAEEGAWRTIRHDDALEVSTRPVAGSQFDEVRVVGNVCASLEALTGYVQDVQHFPDWIPDTAQAEQLAQPNARERIYYVRTDMPWPVKDRDMIYRVVVTPGAVANAAAIEMQGLPDYLPKKEDAIRMTSLHGAWQIEQRAAGLTHVALEMRVEPGGSVPTWLARRRIVALPTGMVENLQREFADGCASRVGSRS
jgi:hypothetical protein